MDLTDVITVYKKTRNEQARQSIISNIKMDSILIKEVLKDMNTVLSLIHANHYTILLEAIHNSNKSTEVVENHLTYIINRVSIHDIEELIHILKNCYPDIPQSKYKKLFKKRLEKLCSNSSTAEDFVLEQNFMDIKKIHRTGIFEDSSNYYLIDKTIVPRLKKHFSVSFTWENKEFINVIHAFITTLQLEAKEKGLSDEVTYLGEGSYSLVFKIGDQVLKLGKGRECNDIPFTPQMVQWRCRRYFKESNLFIEVQPLLDMDNITKEEVAALYISSYRDECVWLDSVGGWNQARTDNAGRLLEDNSYPYEDLTPKARAFLGMNLPSEIVKKKGECVVCDTDYFKQRSNIDGYEEQSTNKLYEQYLEELNINEGIQKSYGR